MSAKNKNDNQFSNKKSFFTFVLLSILALSGISASRPAKADPHAMFYTAIGQQQLFFNVLAALDQADYVETAELREQKREAREAVSAEPAFERETESGGRFTTETELQQDQSAQSENYQDQPGEPALVNRQVTLEGADLYTDELVREYGAEFARRNATGELLVALCENGFNFEECDYDKLGKTPLQKHTIETKRRNATIVEPLDWASLPFWNGAWASLNSGNPDRNIINPHPNDINPLDNNTTSEYLNDEEYRAGKIRWPDIFGWEPVAYSPEMAKWRQIANDTYYGQYTQQRRGELLNGLISTFFRQYIQNEPADFPYQELKFSDNTKEPSLIGLNYYNQDCNNSAPCLNLNAPAYSIVHQPGMTVGKYLTSVSNMMQRGHERINKIASEAAERIKVQQEIVEDEGTIAKTNLQKHPIYPDNYVELPITNYGELTANIDTPVAARKASIYSIPNILGQLATSQQTGSLKGLDIPGNKQLVKRGGDSNTPTESENILGATTASPRVASALDLLFNPQKNFWDEQREETSPSANIVSPILEYGARHALRVLTAGEWRPWKPQDSSINVKACGFTCGADSNISTGTQ